MTSVSLEAQIIPFIIFILIISFWSLNIIYAKTNESIGSKKEVKAFKGMLLSFMVYTLEDIRLIFGNDFYSMLPYLLVCLIISIGFASMSFACFFWFLHVYASLHINKTHFTKNKIDILGILIHIPLLIVVLILFTPLHSIVYILVDDMPVFESGLMIILAMDYIYLIAATGIALYNYKEAKTSFEKRKYGSQTIFILFFTVNGILIAFLLNLPAIELSMIPVVLKLFVELQDSQIYTDALTKLYNRRRMREFITEEISTCSRDNPLSVIMLDLDYFKSINDILGHDEGDKVLIAFSKALRKVIASRNAVAARWGGDEFVVAGKDENLATNIRGLLEAELQKNKSLNFMPPFSVGIYQCRTSGLEYAVLLSEADAALYEDKEKQHKSLKEFAEKLNELKNAKM